MTYADISTTVENGLGVLSLARPEQGNAVRPKTLAEICSAIDALVADKSVRAIILRGEGRNFCAGADFSFLDDLTRMPPAAVQQQIYSHFQGAARRLYHCPKPTIALIAGAAITVGCELALACDFRVAGSNAKFQESWIKLGLMPPLGGLFLLPRLIGLGRATQMVLRGEMVTGETALQIGLVSELVPLEELEERGRKLATELAQLPPIAYAAVKTALHRGLETSIEAEWTANVTNQSVLLSTQDFREGLSAVKEKRAPKFQGA